MKTIQIPLTKGFFATIDEEDYELISKHRWYVDICPRVKGCLCYARIKTDKHNPKAIYMHRLILGIHKSSIPWVDHIDHNGLNNSKSNLRLVSKKENLRNMRPQIGRSSIFKGVALEKSRNNWKASIRINGKGKNLGRFKTEIEAALQYDKYAKLYWGKYAYLNFPTLSCL